MFKRTKELQTALGKRELEIAALNARISELAEKLNECHNRESEIVGVLAEAKATARRVIEAAEARRDAMLSEAAEEKARRQAEADAILNDAKAQREAMLCAAKAEAAKLTGDAKSEAKRMLAQAEASAQEYRQSADKLKAELAEAAFKAQQQAQRFSEFLGTASESAVVASSGAEFRNEYANIAAAVEETPVELPENYRSPAELMRSIYAIQGRDLPEDAVDDAGSAPAQEKPELKAEPKPEPKPEAEERVWTVDEIMREELAKLSDKPREDFGASIDLDAIIEDVLKMD